MTASDITAYTLRPDAKLAAWLRHQERAIVPPWIKMAQKVSPTEYRGVSTRRLESAQLLDFFDGLVEAVQRGNTISLDKAIEGLVAERLGRGYKLTDFLWIADALKVSIWGTARKAFPADRALDALEKLEPIFAHSVSRLAWLASRAAEAHLEEELERTRWNLARLDRTKSDFISIAAHELKTPLTLIQGYSSILFSELERHGKDNPRLHNALQGLVRGAERLHAIIRDMIDVSMIDSNVLTLNYQPVNLVALVRMVVSDLKKEAVDRDVAIRIAPFPEEVGSLFGDPHRLYQVFNNVIGNAIKYTPDGGQITVDARVLPGREGTPDFVEVRVADTGIGIPPEDLPYIFDKFYRIGDTDLHSTGKTKFKGGGPGLGLAIAKGVIEAHGGRIWAESPGYDEERCPGTTMHILLPLHRQPPERASERLLGLEADRPPSKLD